MSVTGKRWIRRSVVDWRGIFARQGASGLGQAAFCAREGIAPSTFALWKKRLAADRGTDGRLVPAVAPWIELGSSGKQEHGWTIELELGGGVCLRLRRGVE